MSKNAPDAHYALRKRYYHTKNFLLTIILQYITNFLILDLFDICIKIMCKRPNIVEC